MSTILTAIGTYIYDMVSCLDHVKIVLNDNDGIASIHQPIDDRHQHTDVLKVKPCCRLIEEVDRIAGISSIQFARQLDPLTLTPGESR